jgi:ABC-type multidrug transport system fused ATPase/permease subunit
VRGWGMVVFLVVMVGILGWMGVVVNYYWIYVIGWLFSLGVSDREIWEVRGWGMVVFLVVMVGILLGGYVVLFRLDGGYCQLLLDLYYWVAM